MSLNESPSEKEGKFASLRVVVVAVRGLNESPSEKEGKFPPAASQMFATLVPQ